MSPHPKQDPGPERPESSLHGNSTATSLSAASATTQALKRRGFPLTTSLKGALFLEMLSQSQTLNIPGPHQMGGIPKPFLSYSAEAPRGSFRTVSIKDMQWTAVTGVPSSRENPVTLSL